MPRILVLVFVLVSSAVRAQVADHLKCYKIKDPLKLAGTLDLDTPQFGADAGCKVSTAKLFCVPATKTNVAVKDKATKQPITPLSVGGPDAGDRICYKVKCPGEVSDQAVTDQFGARTLTKLKASLVCTPAVKGTCLTNGDPCAGDAECCSGSCDASSATCAPAKEWVGSWAAAVTEAALAGTPQIGFNNQTVRMITHVSVGGDRVRIRLSNIYGTGSLTIGHATVAKPDTSTAGLGDIDPATLHDLTFNGQLGTTILKGQEALSDPVALPVEDMSDLVVSVFVPTATGPTTWHSTSRQTSFIGAGDQGSTADFAFTAQSSSWYLLSGVDVLRANANGAVVVLGDSLGDGFISTLNENKRWPDRLAKRLIENEENPPAVLNASLTGNRLNHEGAEIAFPAAGPNAGARLNEDVFPQTGVRTVILALGIEDIRLSDDSAAAVIDGIRKVSARVQEGGLRFLVATLTPFEDGPSWTSAKDANRNAVNAFLRTSNEFDGVLDFDQVLRGPASPSKLRPELDAGDHLHPNDAGYQAMADAIPLNLLGP